MTRQRLAEMAFHNFDLTGAKLGREERDSLDSAFRAAHSFAENPRGWLLLQGANGCGKTHLAAAIANKGLADGIGVFFAVVPDLLDELRSGFAPGKEGGYEELFDQIRNTPLLILDDFGAQRSASWAEEKLYQIVNYRTIAELPGVITTDRSVTELQASFPRVVSRVIDPREGNTVAILAPHYRLGRAFTAASSSPRRRGS
jgi:DNA replication protein DnaC